MVKTQRQDARASSGEGEEGSDLSTFFV